ncbi:MAG: T9SS type A sorting domain-containing protein, partial [Aliifodinibius sp.]|nr:T9SS type A sorting domain-containing protein [Fodinibius sp.]NIW47442.1 T9SS type A sorting domain-containing protein [Gammaproteobacteria bacterium]NIX02093.1 T9SS type A sorting domain-containing protein [Phycisphaerae bacterium]NIY28677.1 T9SS type A sorting domain-containing protein [Fodinibius sp.]
DGGGILSVQPDIKLPPQNFRLFQNYPNPFNPTTCIGFAIPKTTKVELSIYDMLGRKVATPMDKWLPAGRHEVEWNAASYSSGIYFYELTAGKYRAVQRMLLIK